MSEKIWYYADGEEPRGVFSNLDLKNLIASGKINDSTLVWRDGMEEWQPLKTAFKNIESTPPKRQAPRVPEQKDVAETSGTMVVGEVGPSRGFTESVEICFKKAFVFSGRASRSEYWYFFLFYMLVLFAAFFIEFEIPYATTIVVSVFLIPILAVQVRRMHDVKRSGWWAGTAFLLNLFNYLSTKFLFSESMTLADYDWGIFVLIIQFVINAIVFVFTLKKGIP